MPIATLIGASDEPAHSGVRMDDAQLLLGDWTWEPAISRPVEEIEEGPLGSVDLTRRCCTIRRQDTAVAQVAIPQTNPQAASDIG
jgi:hypothetical protein